MKPAADIRFSTRNVTEVHGGNVEPLSKLAAVRDSERAEHFAFTAEDRQLLEDVLAEEDRLYPAPDDSLARADSH